MKKPRLFVVLIIFLFLLAPVALANSSIQAVVFPSTFSFNGKERMIEGDYEVLNYKGHAYVPIRFIAESMRAGVDYKAEEKMIEIQFIENVPVKSELIGTQVENDFLLAIYSEKDSYAVDEFPRIWASLTYLGDKEIKLNHSTPLVNFGIIDEYGNDIAPAYRLSNTSSFKKYEQSQTNFLPQYIKGYNANISKIIYPEASSKFPEGRYTIYAKTELLSIENTEDNWEMSTSIEISIVH